MSIFFIRNIPKDYDYNIVYSFFTRYGSINTFSVIYSSDMSFIRFIFLIYKEERSVAYLQEYFRNKSFIIDFYRQDDCEVGDLRSREDIYTERCTKLRTGIIKHLNSNKQEEDNLYFINREKWIDKVKDIQNIINKYT
jgi:RNA recognition motif-containing protein